MQEITTEILLLIIPLALVSLTILAYTLIDWYKYCIKDRTLWLVIILIGSTLGLIIYWLAAPREKGSKGYLEE
jgi:uncharacterized protein (DUF486 family)